MLERTEAITNEVLERITSVLAYPSVFSCLCRYYTETPRVILATIELGVHMLFNSLNAELNPICYLLALLAHQFLRVSRIRVKSSTLRLLLLQMALQGGVGLGLLYNVPPGLSIPCSVFPFI